MIKVAAGKERYFRWYEAICARGQIRDIDSGFERHHVVPRSLGGTNESSNLTKLTYREHFLAHWLLAKFTEDDALRKMRYALHMMSNIGPEHERAVAGWQFEVARRANVLARMGSTLSEEHRAKIGAAHRGTVRGPMSDATRAKLSEAKAGQTHTADARAKISKAMSGRKLSDETKAKLSELRRRRTGYNLSPEHRASIGAAHVGTKRSAETKAKIRSAQVGRKLSASHVEALRASWARRKAAKANNELHSHEVA